MGLGLSGGSRGLSKLKKLVVGIVSSIKTSWSATPLDTNLASEKLVKDSLDLKADITPATGATSALRALFIARGYNKATNTYYCVYNTNTGYYEMNGLTDITEAEMLDIYIASLCLESIYQTGLNQIYNLKPTRTLYPISWRNNFSIYADAQFQGNTTIQIFKTLKISGNTPDYSKTSIMFYGCTELQIVDSIRMRNILNAANADSMFYGCVKLETALLQGLKVALSFAWSPLLSLASLQYLVTNRLNGTTRITITVHPTVWSKLNDSENYPEWNALLVDAVANKYIDFASA